MCNEKMIKSSIACELLQNDPINREIFKLVFAWQRKARQESAASRALPQAGQFFMVKPKRSGVFLGRPISVAYWKPASECGKWFDNITFLIARKGRGTEEFASMRRGELAELTGPLGNAWTDFLPPADNGKPIALVGGGVGVAPLNALLRESTGHVFDLYIGFRNGFKSDKEKNVFLDSALPDANKMVIATEDGRSGHRGRIPDFFDPEPYAAVCACGPDPMLKAIAVKCNAAKVPCFISMERRMACGVGACMGCMVKTAGGNRRCCSDGPIFNAQEVFFGG